MKTDPSGPSRARAEERVPSEGRDTSRRPTFPEVLAGPGSGVSGGAGASDGEGAGVDAPEALLPALATQALVASQALAFPREAPTGSPALRFARRDPLDPAERQAAQLAPPLTTPAPEHPTPRAPAGGTEALRAASLEEVLPAIVRRVAWSGDGRKGSLRLEFGAGALAGGTLVVHADDGRVRVELHAPDGTDAAAWRDRIAARLDEKRIQVDEIVVE